MRRWIQRVVIIALVLCGLVATMRYLFRDDIRALALARTEAELKAIVIPRFELRHSTFPEAIATLESEAHRAGMRKVIRFSILSEEEHKHLVFRREVAASHPLPGVTFSSDSTQPLLDGNDITISLSRIPVIQAARYVAALGGAGIRVKRDAVEFIPGAPRGGTYELLVTKTFRIHRGFGWPDSETDVREFLESLGMKFYEGATARYDPEKSSIIIRNTSEQLDFLDMVVPLEPGATILEQIRFRVSQWIHPETIAPALPPSLPPTPAELGDLDVPAVPGLEPLPGSD